MDKMKEKSCEIGYWLRDAATQFLRAILNSLLVIMFLLIVFIATYVGTNTYCVSGASTVPLTCVFTDANQYIDKLSYILAQ